ncbi:hypothetical protein UFOVP585_61, partial [uncultured Caudovirales phage]
EMCYQVGTSLSLSESKTHRDVDVRIMLDTKEFKTLQKIVNVDRLSVAVSIWGQKVTGLPIDFQIQDTEYANVHHNGYRSAIGVGGVARGDGHDGKIRTKSSKPLPKKEGTKP